MRMTRLLGSRMDGGPSGATCAIVVLAMLLAMAVLPAGPSSGDGGTDLGSADQLLFSTFLGTTMGDRVIDLVCDDAGNTYVTGMTRSAAFPNTTGAYDTTYNGGSDVFVCKFDANGSKLVWSTFVGGSGNEYGECISIDSSGNVVVSTSTTSTGFPTTPGCYDNTSNGGSDIVIFKLDPTGSSLKFSTFIGGSKDEVGLFTLDAEDNVFIAGYTSSTNFPTTIGAYDRSYNGGSSDLVAAKLKADGSSLVFSTYVGGSDVDQAYRPPALDGAGNMYLTGETSSADFPTVSGCYDTTKDAYYDAFAIKLDPTGGDLDASTFIGGSWSDAGEEVSVNPRGEVVVSGTVGSSDYPVVTGAYDTTYNGGYDMVVSILDGDLTRLLHSTFVGGSKYDTVLGMELDPNGTVYLVGSSESTDYPIAADYYDGSHNGQWDVVITRLSANLSVMYNSTFLGGTWFDESRAIHLDARNDMFLGGRTFSTGFPVTSGAFDTSQNGGEDGFVLKFRFPEDPNHFLDDDNDGVLNWEDAFPRNPFEFRDTDGDGMGDNLDPDADGDGVPDVRDDFPLDPSETRDTDRDGVGDNADTDDDGDGVNDTADAFPRDPSEILDSDGDGIGDNLDPDDDNDNVTDEQEFLDTLGRQFDNLSASLDLLGAILRGELDDVNASLLDTMEDLSDGFLDELSAVNSSLASSIQTTLASLMGSVEGLNVSISADIGDLDAWLAEVLAALDIQLARANATLHSHVTGLEGRTAGFYDALARDLAGISVNLTSARDQLSSNNKAIVDDIDALSDLMSDLHGTTLSELRDRLTTIGANLSSFDRATADRLTSIANEIAAFEASLVLELVDLEKLGSVLGELEDLEEDLSSAREELDSSIEDASSEELGRLNLNLVLLVIVLVLTFITIILIVRSHKTEPGANP